jgi:Trk K+ transport system NAD-binding subunit
VQRLDAHGIQTVVVDASQQAIEQLEADEVGLAVPGLCGDSSDPDILNIAGVQRENCVGVVALTNDDHINLSVAIDAKLVNPGRPVISRSQSKETTANLASFGTDSIIDPFETYAEFLVQSVTEPYKHIITDLILNPHHNVWASPHQDTSGRWVVCGYGRFGKAIEKKFLEHDIPVTFIEADPSRRNAPEGTVMGVGTEEETLRQADLGSATGIVAGTPDDADNLSIIITARQIKSDIITVARQNLASNKPVFRAANVNMIMEPVRIIADEIFVQIKTPLMIDFIYLLREQDEAWGKQLLMRISGIIEEQSLDAWTYTVSEQGCPAVYDRLKNNGPVVLDNLLRDPRKREEELPAMSLLLKREGEYLLLPDPSTRLQLDDVILMCGQHRAQVFMNWITHNHNVLLYIRSGVEAPGGVIWRWFSARRRKWRREAARRA